MGDGDDGGDRVDGIGFSVSKVAVNHGVYPTIDITDEIDFDFNKSEFSRVGFARESCRIDLGRNLESWSWTWWHG